MVGGEGIKERADFLAMAIKFGFTLHDLATHGERLLAGDRCAERADRRSPPRTASTSRRRADMSFSRWLRGNAEHYLLVAAQERIARQYGRAAAATPHGASEIFWLRVFAPVYRALPWPLRHKIMLAMPGSHRRQWAPPPQSAAARPCSRTPSREAIHPRRKEVRTMAQIVGERVSKGDAIVDYDDKVFEDIQAEPGEKAYILMHTVPFEGSVGLVNMLTATRINRKGFDTHLVLYGPGSLMAAADARLPEGRRRGLPRCARLQQAAADVHGRGRPRLRLPVLRRRALRHARDRHDGGRQADQPARCSGLRC